jgi:hypothetical protein
MTEHAVVIAGGGPIRLMWRASWRWRASTLPLSSGAPARTSPARALAVTSLCTRPFQNWRTRPHAQVQADTLWHANLRTRKPLYG